jgi:hypothetical protein
VRPARLENLPLNLRRNLRATKESGLRRVPLDNAKCNQQLLSRTPHDEDYVSRSGAVRFLRASGDCAPSTGNGKAISNHALHESATRHADYRKNGHFDCGITFSDDFGCGSLLHSVNFEYAWPLNEPSWPAPSNVGEWLSLVEHLVRDQGVGGSNPLSPTILFNYSQIVNART